MEILRFKATDRREDGLTVINNSSIPFPDDFKNNFHASIVFTPGSKGGNHKHPRTELFYSTGDLTLVYLDEDGKKIEVSMAPEENEYKLFVITPYLPHAVVNRTKKDLVLVEFADGEQVDVEPVKII